MRTAPFCTSSLALALVTLTLGGCSGKKAASKALPQSPSVSMPSSSSPTASPATAMSLPGIPPAAPVALTVTPLADLASYHVASLGTFKCTAVNRAGFIAAITESGHAALISPDHKLTDLGTPSGSSNTAVAALNDSNTVVGASVVLNDLQLVSGSQAASFANGAWRGLGFLAAGTQSSAAGINDRGDIVGAAYIDAPQDLSATTHAFVRSAGGAMQDLGTLGTGWSRAYAINSAGVVAGSADLADGSDFGRTHACTWTHGKPTDLGTLGGKNSAAQAINDQGMVAGLSEIATDSDVVHAFIYSGGKMTDLGTLPSDTQSRAQGVSGSGVVVGTSRGVFVAADSGGGVPAAADGDTSDGNDLDHPFVYRDGAMQNLLPSGSDGRAFLSADAIAVNDAGEIVGWGTNADGALQCLVWTNK